MAVSSWPTNEWQGALWRAGALLGALWLAKALAPLAWLGSLAATAVALGQLYVPIWRCDARNLPLTAVGLSWPGWRPVLRAILPWALLCLPLYAAGVHLGLIYLPRWLGAATGGGNWAWQPAWPATAAAWLQRLALSLHLLLLHLIGVALPEEAFYRGYLQPQLQARWPARGRLARAGWDVGSLTATGLFAVGHFVGEWQPARLLTFFPGLMFARLRQQQGNLAACIGLHALCNLFAAAWLACYQHRN